MELTLKDRLMIPGLIPSKGKFEDLVVREDVIEKIKVTQEEVKKFNIRQGEKGGLLWDAHEDTFSVEFSELELGLIKKALKELSDKGELTHEHLELYRVFIQ